MSITYQKCLPRPGTHVAMFCAGLRGAPFAGNGEGDFRDFCQGAELTRFLPKRTAKKRATRILHEHRMNARRWCSRGNAAASVAVPLNSGFTRFPS